jgi:catechol 2,3-dioxygenase-like lactoylglutathione lyase family enzyme
MVQVVAFYQHAAGFAYRSAYRKQGPAGIIHDAVVLAAPHCQLELVNISGREPPYRPVNAAGITHFCLQTDQIEPLYSQFAASGATFHAVPLQLATGNMYCYARDPENNVVELEALPNAPANLPPWIAHVALATPDVARLATFYHAIVGGTRAGGQEIGLNPLYDTLTGLQDMRVIPTWIIGANITIELWQFLNPPTLAVTPHEFGELGYNHICFEVTNLAEALAEFKAAGAYDATPAFETAHGQCVYLRDPDGNWLELLEIQARIDDDSEHGGTESEQAHINSVSL